MNSFIGSVLLVAGTTIGAGMLGLPIITSFAGFWPTLVLFFLCWLFMLTTAFLFVDVTLSCPDEVNLISMAERTLGKFGKAFSWVFYLLLLYALLSAYIAGSASLFGQLVSFCIGRPIPSWLSPLIMPLVFGGVLYLGVSAVDYINRYLMLGLGISFAFLVGCICPHVEFVNLGYQYPPALMIAVTVLFTSFGYHIIIPTLVTYLKRDRKRVRLALFWGSGIAFATYVLWEVLIHGSLTSMQLVHAWENGETVAFALANTFQNQNINLSSRFFTFFNIVTSFLGVSLALSAFLMDGLRLKKTGQNRFLILGLTVIPPILFVYFYEKSFYTALRYAGTFVAALLCFLPACMSWMLKEPSFTFYRSWRGRTLLCLLITLSICVIGMDLCNSPQLTDSFIASAIERIQSYAAQAR